MNRLSFCRFAECLPICAMGASGYAIAIRAFARSEFWFMKEIDDLVVVKRGSSPLP